MERRESNGDKLSPVEATSRRRTYATINDEEDYTKAGNYWRWLKKKLTGEGIQLVSATHEFKFEAPDGKRRKAPVQGKRYAEYLRLAQTFQSMLE